MKILGTVCEIITGISLFIILGAVGGIEAETLSLDMGVLEAVVGLILMAIFGKLSAILTENKDNVSSD